LGVDDFALRHRHPYGAPLVALDRGPVIDLLPDRTAATLTAGLTCHPAIRVTSRGRASAHSRTTTDTLTKGRVN
jgi:hypothetical protein